MVPARAGVIPNRLSVFLVSSGGSRASGGDPALKYLVRADKKWFPRERG